MDELLDKICDEFAIRDWEGKVLKLGENEYTQNNLPPRKRIEEIIRKSMKIVITNQEPERKFVEKLCKLEYAQIIDAWVKSKDKGFYSIEYTLKYGGRDSKTRKYSHKKFNPDFFIKINKDKYEYILVVEVKENNDNCKENKAKYKYAKDHFKNLNAKLEKLNIKQKYIIHFLSPNGYDEFFDFLKTGKILENQEIFRCELENLLESDKEQL